MKKYGLVFISICILCIVVFLFINTKSSSKTDNSQSINLINIKNRMGIELEKYTEDTKINNNQAIEIAKQSFKIENQQIQKYLITYSEKKLTKVPVWIVTYKTEKITRSGGTGITDTERMNSSHNFKNIVIDANSGKILFNFDF